MEDIQITAWARLQRSANHTLELIETDLKQNGFPPLSWYDVLLELRRAGPDGIRPFQLQEKLLLAQYNLSRLLDRLIKAGYVTRTPCHEDGRGHIVHATPSGLDLLKRMWPFYRKALEKYFASYINSDQAAIMADILKRLMAK